jgi:replicative DNA helicase
MVTAEEFRVRLNDLHHDFEEEIDAAERESWTSPIPLDPTSGPPFPLDALPGAIGQMVEAVAEETQTPADLPALVALGTLSAAAGGKYVAYVPSSNYTEPVHAMFLPVAEPGNRKSSVYRHITAPLGAWEREQQDQEEPTIAQWESRLRVLEKQLAAAESEQGKPAKDGKLTIGDASRMAAVEALQEHKKARPVPTEIFTDDATPESVKERIIAQGGALAVMSAESAYLSNVAGRYSNAPHLDTILNGHAGDEIKVSRKGKPTERAERACLTLCLMVQPQVIESLGQIEGFRDRGAAARLLPAFPADIIGTRRIATVPVPSELMQAWDRLVRDVLDVRRTSIPRVLRLDPAALSAYDAYRTALEPTIKSEGRDMQGWLAKLAGAVLRIAGLLHIAQHPHPESVSISAGTIADAIRIGTCFHGHARIMFSMMYGRHGQSDAASILDVLRTLDAPSISKRDLYQTVKRRTNFHKVDGLNDALDVLEEHGWVQRAKLTGPKGGRPSEIIFIHPDLGPQYPQNPGTGQSGERFGGIEDLNERNAVPLFTPSLVRESHEQVIPDTVWRVEI